MLAVNGHEIIVQLTKHPHVSYVTTRWSMFRDDDSYQKNTTAGKTVSLRKNLVGKFHVGDVPKGNVNGSDLVRPHAGDLGTCIQQVLHLDGVVHGLVQHGEAHTVDCINVNRLTM